MVGFERGVRLTKTDLRSVSHFCLVSRLVRVRRLSFLCLSRLFVSSLFLHPISTPPYFRQLLLNALSPTVHLHLRNLFIITRPSRLLSFIPSFDAYPSRFPFPTVPHPFFEFLNLSFFPISSSVLVASR
jgi:hypothetical protein